MPTYPAYVQRLLAQARDEGQWYCGQSDAAARWWRDNAYRLPWLPPTGDGSRYKRMMSYIDPDAPDDKEVIKQLRQDVNLPELVEQNILLEPELAGALDAAMSTFSRELTLDEYQVDCPASSLEPSN